MGKSHHPIPIHPPSPIHRFRLLEDRGVRSGADHRLRGHPEAIGPAHGEVPRPQAAAGTPQDVPFFFLVSFKGKNGWKNTLFSLEHLGNDPKKKGGWCVLPMQMTRLGLTVTLWSSKFPRQGIPTPQWCRSPPPQPRLGRLLPSHRPLEPGRNPPMPRSLATDGWFISCRGLCHLSAGGVIIIV